jgi:hypothetical protein
MQQTKRYVMRSYVTAVVLLSLQFAGAQAQDTGQQTQSPPAAPGAPRQRQRVRQAAAKDAGSSESGKAQAQSLAASAPIVTFQGLCGASQAKTPCRTVITREDLDRFVNAFSPNATGAAKGQLAVQYARILAYSLLAEQYGLDKDPAMASEIEAQLRLIRMRILATAFAKALGEQAPASTDAEIQDYYETHQDQYQQVLVRRISVPLDAPNETGRPLDRAKVHAAMEEVRKQASGGEDFNKLQQQAYEEFHIQAKAAAVNAVSVRVRSLVGDEAKVADLKPGEISSVLDLPVAVTILKLESKGPAPLASVRPEIETWLRGTKAQVQLGNITSSIKTEFNLQYLDLPSQPDMFGPGLNRAAGSEAGSRRVPATKP